MTMMRKTITIPDAMEEWIKARIETGGYANDSEYLRDLIRRDQERHGAGERLRELIAEGLESGMSEHSVEDVRTRVEARLKADGRL